MDEEVLESLIGLTHCPDSLNNLVKIKSYDMHLQNYSAL